MLAGGSSAVQVDSITRQVAGIGRISKRLERDVQRLLQAQRTDRLLIKRLQTLLELGAPPDEQPTPAPVDPQRNTAPATVTRETAGRAADMLVLDACPVCRAAARSEVCEYNRFIYLDTAPDEAAAAYHYVLCHGCGVVYATVRPTGARYRHLQDNFQESLGRIGRGQSGDRNPIINPYPLTESDHERVRQQAKRGVFVSEHQQLSKKEWLPGALADRMSNAVHVEVLGSLLELKSSRVLEIRSRTGSVLNALRRLFNSDVCALPLFESQQALMRELYQIPSASLLDYDNISIPYDGQFDLIICNHILTHVVRPQRFFDALRAHLAPGGHVYLYNEPDDAEFLSCSQPMFKVLNAFHLQTFDSHSLVRALRVNCFEPLFLSHVAMNFVCLARVGTESAYTPMTDAELAERLRAYRRARDYGIVCLPQALRERYFKNDWDGVLERAVRDGLADIDDRGRIVVNRAGVPRSRPMRERATEYARES